MNINCEKDCPDNVNGKCKLREEINQEIAKLYKRIDSIEDDLRTEIFEETRRVKDELIE